MHGFLAGVTGSVKKFCASRETGALRLFHERYSLNMEELRMEELSMAEWGCGERPRLHGIRACWLSALFGDGGLRCHFLHAEFRHSPFFHPYSLFPPRLGGKKNRPAV
jgi:hypothetical protein